MIFKNTALHTAVSLGNTKIVELLLSQKGIDLDIKIIFIYLIDTISKYINQSNFIFLYYNSVLKLIF